MSREVCLFILVNHTQHRIISNVIYIAEFQNKPNVALQNLKGFSYILLIYT